MSTNNEGRLGAALVDRVNRLDPAANERTNYSEDIELFVGTYAG